MAVTHPAAPSRLSSNDALSRPALFPRIALLGIALVCASAGLVIAHAYPLQPLVTVALFIAWCVFAGVRISIALPAMLALLPIVGLAPHTGWLTFEEFDLFALATSAGGYAGLALQSGSRLGMRPDPRTARGAARLSAHISSALSRNLSTNLSTNLSIVSIALIALFLASTAIALERGIAGAGGFRFDWFQGYDDPLNSLRIFKSFALVVLMLPLVQGELQKPGGSDRIGFGITLALGLGAFAVLQERLAFTGLLDFSDDYRATGSFWEMHVGGAALDGFLALTIPFAIREALRHAHWSRFLVGAVVLALAAYASLVTFSRGVYLAVPISLLLLVVLVFRQRLRLDRRMMWWVLAKGAAFAIVVAACGFMVFRGGGYRAVIAAIAVLALTIAIDASIRRTRPAMWLAALIGAALLGALGAAVASVLPKGPYVVFTLASFACIASLIQAERTRTTSAAIAAIIAWLWLAIAACVVAGGWGGRGALRDSVVVMGLLVVIAFIAARMKRPVWPARRREQLATIGFAALVMGSVAIFAGGAYMGGRFSTSRGDLDSRIAHWTEGISRLKSPDQWLLGKGLGRFPATSLYESLDAAIPGSYHLVHRSGETFLSLSGPRIKYLGFGEFFRVSQRVSVQPNAHYVLTIEARTASPIALHIEICEKQLLYNSGCAFAGPVVQPAAGKWQTLVVPLDTKYLGGTRWYAPKPVFFAIAVASPGLAIEIRNLRLVGPRGAEVLANGDFSNRMAHWFSSSDKYHLPWHIKNLALDLLFDQGVVGLALFTLLVAGALIRTALGRAQRHPDAPYVAAAIVGFVIVGAFDSLLDVPRVAFLFYFVVMLGLMLRNPRATRVVAQPPAPPSRPIEPAIDVELAARERAQRRRRAFGERGGERIA